MNELVTLPRKSPEFESYMRGSFSNEKRALPLQTLNVNSPFETVTFRILPLAEISKPSFFKRILVTFKIRSFLLALLPMFVILAKNIRDKTVLDPWVVIFSTLGVLFALMAVNLRNEYVDHMKGADRVLTESGSGAIQKGWVTAAQVQFYSNFWLALALLLSLLVAFAFPTVTLVAGVALVLGVWAQFLKSSSFKYQIGGELSLFLLLGPLLAWGYQLSMGSAVDQEILFVGIVWGLFVLFLHHLRNFLNIFSSTQAGFTNTVNWLGFDKSRRLLAAWWLVSIAAFFCYLFYFVGLNFALLSGTALVLAAVPFIRSLKKISSPMGSQIRSVYRQGYFLFLMVAGIWFLESLWTLNH